MSTSFLHKTAAHMLAEQGKDLQKTVVFLPNRTGINFFRKALAETANSAVWAPVCLTPGKQMEKASGLVIGHKIRLAAELHRVHQQVLAKDPEPFERFFPWADLLLNDFDDIDKYLADAKVLYANLAGLKNIYEQFAFLTEDQVALIRRFWKSYEEPSITDSKERFLRIWEKLYEIYDTYTRILPQKGFGYEGLLHRKAVENPEGLLVGLEGIQAAYVVGFNRLNACERRFFGVLRKNIPTQFFYDAHPLTAKDPLHEAGRFYRETSLFFPPKNKEEEREIKRPVIDIVSVSGSTTAVKYAAGEVEKALQDGQRPEDILVMMPDEKQLMPLLYSLPEALPDVNITSGLGLSETPIVSLLKVLYTLRKNAVQKPSGLFFRLADVVKALQHPYLNFDLEPIHTALVQTLKKGKRIRPEQRTLTGTPLHASIFVAQAEMPFHTALTQVLQFLLQSEQVPLFERRILQTACESAVAVDEIIRLENLPSDDKASFTLLNSVLRGTRIPFEGEPVVGMQLMGPLETRNLDFKTVIIPAMSEDLFPGAGNAKTYIPFALRRAFGMPLPEDRMAELSHIFYRLLQRTEKVVLIANTSAGPMTTGEPSRFILRLEADDFYAPLLHKKAVVESVQFRRPETLVIPKTGQTLATLLSLTDEGAHPMYPTAINTYLECTLRFYFRYIAGIKEQDELSEIADHAAFGSIFHWVMEWLYVDFVGREIHESDIQGIRQRFDALSERAFKKHFGYADSETFDFEGETLLQREIIRKYVYRVLELDAQYAPFTVIGLELGEGDDALRIPFPFATAEGTKTIRLGGKIDRVDQKGGITRILDYKTGSDALTYTDIPALFDRSLKKRNKAAFQTWLYGVIYGQNYPQHELLQAGIVSVRNMFEEGFNPIIKEKQDPLKPNSGYQPVYNLHEKQAEFIERLQALFSEMYNTDIPFTQTENTDKCKTCPYREICRR